MDTFTSQLSHHSKIYISAICSWPWKVLQSRSGVVELKATPLWRHKSRLCLQSDGLSVTSSFQGIEKNMRELSQGNRVDVQEVGGNIPLLLPWWCLPNVAVHCLGGEGHVLFEACVFFSLPFPDLETLWYLNSILCSFVCLQTKNISYMMPSASQKTVSMTLTAEWDVFPFLSGWFLW